MIFVHDSSTFGKPPSFLPMDLDSAKGKLTDVTQVGDSYRVFIDLATGQVHDGAEYHRQFVEALKKERQ